jgi:hypothetical protein
MFLFAFIGSVVDQTMVGKDVGCFGMPLIASEKNGVVLVVRLWPCIQEFGDIRQDIHQTLYLHISGHLTTTTPPGR